MRTSQCDCSLARIFKSPGHGQWTVSELVAQRSPFEQLRDNAETAVFGPEIKDRKNVGMGERRHGLRFALQSSALRCRSEGVADNFYSTVAAQSGVERTVNLAHAARRNTRANLVGPQHF